MLIAGRLPDHIRPVTYEIHVTVDLEQKSFSGDVAIDIQLTRPVEAITLHALGLKIEDAQRENGDHAYIAPDSASETVTLHFANPTPAGAERLSLSFSGTLNKQLRGLYEAHAHSELYAFTQFEATDARRMFPCFDEPGMKARFKLSVTLPSQLTAISNMPAVEEETDGKMKTVLFDTTPKMSTYLLCLGVARLEKKEIKVGDTRVSVWATQGAKRPSAHSAREGEASTPITGQLHLSSFALKVTSGVLPLLNDYFDLPYPYPKLDLVAVPDFAMGAMENWGAIFFRDSRLLLDETLASTGTKRGVANVITHEIVHQWFGNLVTMAWWDDLWLNESFATWLAVKIVDQWMPEWNAWVEFQQEKQIPLSVDALKSTRAICAPVENTAQIEEMFDALTYEKGAACLRMIEHFLGEGPFRDGIRQYMRKHQFENVTAAVLWEELSISSGQPVAQIAQDWFTQAGFPMVTIGALSPREITLTQRRFFGEGAHADSTLWHIPFTFKYRDADGEHHQRVLLKDQMTPVLLPGKGPIEWLYGNAEESGFVRVGYDPAIKENLIRVIPNALTSTERIGLLNHLWALCVSGDLSMADFMDTLCRFKGDQTRVVVEALGSYLETLYNQMVLAADRPRFAKRVSDLFNPLWEELGWDAKQDEEDERRLTRASILWALGAFACDEEILAELPRRQQRYWAKPESLDPTLATPLIRLCARVDGGTRFDTYLNKFKMAATPEERDRYLMALADFSKPSLAQQLLEFSLSDSVRSQDVWKPARYLLANPLAQEVAWAFIKGHWGALKEKGGSVGAQRMIQGARHLWRRDLQMEVAQFFSAPENKVAAAERALAQTLEFMELGVRFKARCRKALSDWMGGG